MPFALIEALLAGTPVVATDAGGVVDLLADPRDGCLVPKGDAAALYEGLCSALDLPLEREERAARSEGRFGLEQMGRTNAGLVIHWSSVDGKRYRVERATNLLGEFNVLVKTNIFGVAPLNTETDTTATGVGPWSWPTTRPRDGAGGDAAGRRRPEPRSCSR